MGVLITKISTFLSSALGGKLTTIILGVALALAALAYILWHSLTGMHERTGALESLNQAQTLAIDTLEITRAKDNAATISFQEATNAIRKQTSEQRAAISAGRQSDTALNDWHNSPLPSVVVERLRKPSGGADAGDKARAPAGASSVWRGTLAPRRY
jgi:hypothetical protein